MSSELRSKLAVHNNKHGFRGVWWDARRQRFRAEIWPVPNGPRRRLGSFLTAEDAAQAYDHAARAIHGAAAHLNFPGSDELAVTRSRHSEGFCPAGHALGEHGYRCPDGAIQCKKCGNDASLRRYYRNKRAASGKSVEKDGDGSESGAAGQD